MDRFDYKNCCASVDLSIRKVAELIDRLTLKTVYITSSENKLVGSVTDGDLRRAIIDGVPLDQNIARIMNSNPKFTFRGKNEHIVARELMLKLNLKTLPVVDKQMYIVDILLSNRTHGVTALENPVIIMAGGLGSRLMPLTKMSPSRC